MRGEKQLLRESAQTFVLTGILLNLSILAGASGVIYIIYSLLAQLSNFQMFLYQIYPV